MVNLVFQHVCQSTPESFRDQRLGDLLVLEIAYIDDNGCQHAGVLKIHRRTKLDRSGFLLEDLAISRQHSMRKATKKHLDSRGSERFIQKRDQLHEVRRT